MSDRQEIQQQRKVENINVSHDENALQVNRNAFALEPLGMQENNAGVSAEEKRKFDYLHNVDNHSKRFLNIINNARREVANSAVVYTLRHLPDQSTLGKEYKSKFNTRLSDEARLQKSRNKKSRIYQKHRNAELLKETLRKNETDSFDLVNRAMTGHAMRCEKDDYHDLAMFMKEGQDKKNINLINLYLGKSLKAGPGGLEGQDVQLALDNMAGQLFSVDVSSLRFDNDTEMVQNATELERISGQLAAFERMAEKHNYMASLDEFEKKRLNDRLDALRSVAAYYNIRKDIITDDYYKNHYNDELSLDVNGAETAEQKKLAENLLKSLVVGRKMMKLNGVDLDRLKYNGQTVSFKKEVTRELIKQIDREYSKAETHKEIIGRRFTEKDAIAEKELLRLQKRVTQLNKIDPVKERKAIADNMAAVRDRAYVPVERPDSRIGGWGKFKNRVRYGYRFLFGATLGAVFSFFSGLYTGAETLFTEKSRKENAQEKRRHDIVPGREGEYFRDEIIRKDENGEDIDVYSDYRRGPLIWEKLSAGDPEDPPEVCIMVEQSKRGSALASADKMGHAMIGLSYSRYNKNTKRKERYQLRMGYYPGGGLRIGAGMAMSNGAIVGGRVGEDDKHEYDIARRYQVKPGDINKILREAEKYGDKGYGYYKRNCTTFVVDMAKSINLPIAEEFKEEEMDFEGGAFTLMLEGAQSMPLAGYYMGANAISSRMNKMDLEYQNFGQKLYTKEDLERYYKTANTGSLFVRKGYTPGTVGETLRYAKDGELTADYVENEDLDVRTVKNTIAVTGSRLWIDITNKIPQESWTEDDDASQQYFMDTLDGGLNDLCDKPNECTAEAVRGVHKKVRTAMKGVNNYYSKRLGNDPALNESVMKLLSLYELVLTRADILYAKVVESEVKGDVGRLRYNYIHKNRKIIFRENGEEVTCEIPPGVYEGYLMQGKSAEEAIRESARLKELRAIPKKERTSAQKLEKSRLDRSYSLAKSFAKANRYLLEKDDFEDKDIKYAFTDLPVMENQVKQGQRLSGDMLLFDRPSYAYQGVILDKIFGNVRGLNLDQIDDLHEQVRVMDNYSFECFEKNKEFTRKILSYYIKGKNGSAVKHTNDFLTDMSNSLWTPAYSETILKDLSAVCMLMMGDTKTRHWLVGMFTEVMNEQPQEGGVA